MTEDARRTRRWFRAVHRPRTARLISGRGLRKLSNRQSGRPVAFRSLVHCIRCTSYNALTVFSSTRSKSSTNRSVLADHNAMVVHLDATLLLYREASIAQLLRQGILVDLFQESRPERIQHGECATDHSPRQIIQSHAI